MALFVIAAQCGAAILSGRAPQLTRASARASVPPTALLNLSSANLQPEDLTVGRTVIPTLAKRWDSNTAFRAKREELFANGLFPGVDYIVEGNDGVLITLRPAYPLVKKLERDWPVAVPWALAPRWTTPAVYNAFTAAFALGLAATWLLLGLILSTGLTLSKIPSASMQPAIQPGDVLLVEKVTPRLGLGLKPGEMVFFEPPLALRTIVSERQGAAASAAMQRQALLDPSQPQQLPSSRRVASPFPSSEQLFVKRVAAVPGDRVRVFKSGNVDINADINGGGARGRGPMTGSQVDNGSPPQLLESLLRPGDYDVPRGSVFVLGDNSEVSIDSRCWLLLPRENVVGRPILRVFPLSRFGMVE